MIYRKHTLFEQGLNCAVILFVGIISAPFIPGELRMKLAPFVLLGCVLVLCLNFFYEQKRGRADIQREQRDERSQMILERAVWYCRQIEDRGLLILFCIVGLCFQRYEIAYTLYWFIIGRSLLTFAIRWWLERRY
ncbi:hypothetical protein D1646_12220 [Pseudoflavonifractor sp. 60]|uniref:hypothetical protein n=1 Tax=Pseudoflavonifractor sp. 60 TaxID=2304576 RepID=UPI001371A6FE|nr:hypothetical protein [Pseudoflavonifractor sp. 60]NBI67563.1 hypothetical protein [Pseudoflavonifractor sp. 60]